jgi:hypothetical protein
LSTFALGDFILNLSLTQEGPGKYYSSKLGCI